MEPSTLFAGVVLSSVGLGYALYGRKQRAVVPLLCGIGLMVVPYVVASVAVLLLIGLVLAAIPWVVGR